MGKFLFPDEYYDSTYSINFKKYYKAVIVVYSSI